MKTGPELVSSLRDRTGEMLDALESIVSAESPSSDAQACASCAGYVATVVEQVLGVRPEPVVVEGRTHLRLTIGEPRLLLLGHFDTVWPLGTSGHKPFAVVDGRATGPGVFDMKAGIVQGAFAVACLNDPSGIAMLLTCDEEIGSPSSQRLIEDTARGLDAVLVLEPSAGGPEGLLKTARKGVAGYVLEVTGRAAHAGLEPEKGANALIALAGVVQDVAALGRPQAGTTVTPTVASAGTTENTVPALARVYVDVRTPSFEERDRVAAGLGAIRAAIPGCSVRIASAKDRPPLPESSSADLFTLAGRLAAALGLPALRGTSVGGGSDGNFTAGIGVPTLDGLGAVGDGAHADDEHVLVEHMAPRAALVAALCAELLGR